MTPWLQQHRPDVVCLQELQCTAAQFPHSAVREAGYRAQVVGQKGKNGVAILTRLDAPEPQQVPEPWPPTPSALTHPSEARFTAARVTGVVVASIYVPYGRTPDDPMWAHKLQFLADVKTWAHKVLQTGQPLVLAGDFNVAPTPQDATSADALLAAGQPVPEVLWPAWCDPRMRRALQNLMDIGLYDVGAERPEEGRAITMWDDRTFGRQSTFGVRVDLLLVSQAMLARLNRVQVHSAMRDMPRPSDHVPVAADFTQVNRIFGALSGSRLYGLATAQSDTDIRGLFLPSRSELLLGQVPKAEHVQRPKAKGIKNGPTDIDLNFFSPTTFVTDLLAGQPCAWEMLFAPPSAHTEDTTALGVSFVTRLRGRAKALWPKDAKATLAFADRSVNTYLRRQTRPQGVPVDQLTFADDALVGQEGKLLSHALRVLQQAMEMGQEGRITLPRPNAAALAHIKQGKAPLNVVLATIRAHRSWVQLLGRAEPQDGSAAEASRAWALGCVEELHEQHLLRTRWALPASAAPAPLPERLTRSLRALDLAVRPPALAHHAEG